MDEAQWAWFAGVFEGEGCIIFTGVASVCLNVTMTDEDIIERMHEVCGVGYRLSVVQQENRKDQHGWRVTQADGAERVLLAIRPWLGRRRGERADQALERLAQVRRPGYCKRRHSLSGPNLYVSPKGLRQCRECSKLREARRQRRQPT